MRAGQHDAARHAYRDIVARSPGHAGAHFMLGVAQAELRNFPAAVESIDRALALAPVQAAANRLVFANILLDAGLPARAEAQARQVLLESARSASALNVLGVALHRQHRALEAVAAYRAAIATDGSYTNAHLNLAAALADDGRLDEAVAAQRRAVELDASAANHFRLARLQHRSAQVFDAIDAYRRALALDAGDADGWLSLANALADAGLLGEAQGAYREALRRRPGYHEVESTLLINLHYDPAFDAEAIFAAHRDWAARHAAGLAPPIPPRVRSRQAGDRLRVAFLSPALREGPVGAFVTPLFEHRDRTGVELFVYNAKGRRDSLTTRLEQLSDHWHDAWMENDEELAGRIRADGIDILVDLAGHTPGGRPLVLARKPAPVIATWLDYFDTTGLDAVDYLVGDPVSTPPSGAQRFSERVILIEPCRLCYSPPAYAPEVTAPPRARNGFVTFGSFNRLSKLTPAVLQLWAEVLRALPSARLILKNAAFTDARARERVTQLLGGFEIAQRRIELRPHSHHGDMLAEYGDIDIAFDTFPYNGGLTTCEALWMGVPVLTMLGDSMISRQSAALLTAAELTQWIARDRDDFVRRAVAAAADAEGMKALRAGMRGRLRGSSLVDGLRFARKFEAALRGMWEECSRK
jgi:predicted O-linked N-acetylglucosamine transferase (SPINDLY family)